MRYSYFSITHKAKYFTWGNHISLPHAKQNIVHGVIAFLYHTKKQNTDTAGHIINKKRMIKHISRYNFGHFLSTNYVFLSYCKTADTHI